jgi:zinc D-Ala-D-Ala carboxypeptidase
MSDVRIGRSFWLSEFVRSQNATRRGLDNTPTPEARANILQVLGPGMQRVRDSLGKPVQITSGYRSPAVNAAVGGNARSQHAQGLAADFVAPEFGSPRAIVRHLMARPLEIVFDQLIFEGSWVHISFVPTGGRSEILTAHFSGGSVTYTKGLA